MKKKLAVLSLILVLGVSVLTYATDWAISGTIRGTQIISTIATGTPPLVVASTTNVENLNASSLGGATFAAPGAIGGGTPSTGVFTTVTATGGEATFSTLAASALVISNTDNGLAVTKVVDSAGSTTNNLFVKATANSNHRVTIVTTADTGIGVLGIALSTAAADASVRVNIAGNAICIADNTVTNGNLLGVGTTTAGRCKDLGSASVIAVSNQLQIVGRAMDAGAAGASIPIALTPGTWGGLPAGTFTATIANGTSALGTGAITSATCATVVTTTATGTATTDNIMADFNADPTAVTGYTPSANGMLTIIKYPTANNVNFKVCNNTAGSITPGAITLNWRVVR